MKRILKIAAACVAIASMPLFASGCSKCPKVGDVRSAEYDGNPFAPSHVVQRTVIAVSNGFVKYRADFSDGGSIERSTSVDVWNVL